MENFDESTLWQDKEILFDVQKPQLVIKLIISQTLRSGETAVDTLNNIEDTKGNNGDLGTMIFSNLRMLWYLGSNFKINLSIGYDCIVGYDIKTIETKVSGNLFN